MTECFKTKTTVRDSDQCNCTYHLSYQSMCRCLKSDPTRKQAINMTSLHRHILFGGISFVRCNDHISKYITFDWKAGVCSGGSNNKISLILGFMV